MVASWLVAGSAPLQWRSSHALFGPLAVRKTVSATGVARSQQRRSWRDQGCPEVIDVGAGRSGDKAVAQHFEEAVAVIVVEHGPRVAAFRARAGKRVGREDRAGDILGAVDPVGIRGQPPDAGRAA